ncbi:MAG TPA: TolC family protein, partial [Blastocatellia bacterium]
MISVFCKSQSTAISCTLAILVAVVPGSAITLAQVPQAQKPAQQPARPGATQNPNSQIDTSVITQPLQASPPVGPERTGVILSQIDNLTLQDAIRLALLNNLTIEQFRQGVQMAQYALFSSRGVYDVTSTANINFNNSTQPNPEPPNLSGTSGETLTTKTMTYNFTTGQPFEPTGGTWAVNFSNGITWSNSSVNEFNPYYTPTLTLTVTQPLMKNLSIDANRHNIQVAKEALTLSDSQFRQNVIQIINAVQDAYWELVFAIRNENIARNTYDLTYKQLQDNKKQVEAGTLAPLDLRQTEAQLEQNKGTIIAAKQTVTSDENGLKQLMLKNPVDKMWNSVIKPTDEPQFDVPTFSVDESIALALQNRPELEQIRLQALKNQIDINYFKNQLKPQLDFQGQYGTTGLAGTVIPQNLEGAVVPGEFNGGYLASLKQVFSQDFRTVQVGVVSSYPWRNRTARGLYQQALATARQTDANERQQIETIEVSVRNALQAVDATRESYEAAVAGKKAALAQYVGEKEKFNAGLSTTYLVLQQETAYANAEATEIRALTSYNEALANFQLATGTTLISNNVEIPTASQPTQNGGQPPPAQGP